MYLTPIPLIKIEVRHRGEYRGVVHTHNSDYELLGDRQGPGVCCSEEHFGETVPVPSGNNPDDSILQNSDINISAVVLVPELVGECKVLSVPWIIFVVEELGEIIAFAYVILHYSCLVEAVGLIYDWWIVYVLNVEAKYGR
ncbi:MAG: hypothetical protein J7K08_04365 [Thermoplasmata archaeon]|nr:hypothetical protein [Thermoplasmata archaeon]